MLRCDYYPLKEAAEILNCSEGSIINFGANEKLPIYMLTDNYIICGYHVGHDGTNTLFNFHERLMQIKPACLRQLESGNALTTVLLVSQLDDDGAYHPKVRNSDYSPGKDALIKSWESGTDPYLNDDPVTVKDCVMVVMANDLERLQQHISGGFGDKEPLNVNADPKPWLIPNPKDPQPEQPWYIPARYFARQLVNDDSTLLTKPATLTKKIVTSLTTAGIMKRGGKKPFDPLTIKKALSNVTLG